MTPYRSVALLLALAACAPEDPATVGLVEGGPPPDFGPVLLVSETQRGNTFTLEARNLPASTGAYLILGDHDAGPGPCLGALGGLCIDLRGPFRILPVHTDAQGEIHLSPKLPTTVNGVFGYQIVAQEPGGDWVKTNMVFRRLLSAQGDDVTAGEPGTLADYTTVPANTLIGNQIAIAHTGTIGWYGITTTTNGANATLGLYTDVDGAPGTLLDTSFELFPMLPGTNLLFSLSAPQVTPGRYWLMAVFDRPTELNADLAPGPPVYAAPLTYSTSLPSTFPIGSATTSDGEIYAYMMRIDLAATP